MTQDMRLFSFSDFIDPEQDPAVAVAVSGGPDSVALCRMLSLWAKRQKKPPTIHALIVNHDIRSESKKEAETVREQVNAWDNVTGVVLSVDPQALSPDDSALMESARTLRYDLMAAYCRDHDISNLFVAHHRDDQAETVLFRLAKGSGLDGLGGIAPVYDYNDSLEIIRPLLNVPKEDLVAFCEEQEVDFVRDPTNEKTDYARNRLRQARDVLAREGLTSKRLAKTAQRLARASAALDHFTGNMFKQCLVDDQPDRLKLDVEALHQQPAEIRLRVVLKAMTVLQDRHDLGSPYGPGLGRVEQLTDELFARNGFRKQTLGGLIIDRRDSLLILEREFS